MITSIFQFKGVMNGFYSMEKHSTFFAHIVLNLINEHILLHGAKKRSYTH